MEALEIIMKDLRKRIDELQDENTWRAKAMKENEIKIAAYKEQLAHLSGFYKPAGFICRKEDVQG